MGTISRRVCRELYQMKLAVLVLSALALSCATVPVARAEEPADAPARPESEPLKRVELTEEIGPDMLLSALETIKAYPDGATVPVLIDSPGGQVIPTLLFLDMVRVEKEKRHLTLECSVGLLVMSAAAAIYEGMCDVRHSRPETLWLFHEMSGTVRGKADNIEDELAFSRALEHSLAVLVAPRLRMTPEQYLAWIKGRDRFLTTDQMRAMHGCD